MPFVALFISDNNTLIVEYFSTSIIYVLNNFQIMNNLCYRYSITCNSGMHVCTLSSQKKIWSTFEILNAHRPNPGPAPVRLWVWHWGTPSLMAPSRRSLFLGCLVNRWHAHGSDNTYGAWAHPPCACRCSAVSRYVQIRSFREFEKQGFWWVFCLFLLAGVRWRGN